MAARKPKVVAGPPASVREVRVWANENGHAVGARGPLNPAVREAFSAATGRTVFSGVETAQGAESR